ncbi:sulfate reduction electron transfer complex DsrMKJOP subunit DsrO [Aromatoleum aromaticum]|uniref:Molybdenum enzyme, medium subunit,related to phenylacetyl-CoA: acceptor oxidoreductase n=1 Tax=Aromatoleum aromaticum (strain DSM 19018 / LMG 30748 / EbN1) TaxID=76114 RepID=Q5P036_AROAE|nr:4Fe-4S dicluster domain-containing protein [Aromatoleum aromaticum]CAI09328.1 Molybdenum enzyme, medium subunit,related to phenylacetyl-CoA: acceptor oxidoreductase [Aromatoleum aromaticum EbN1]
MRWGMVIDLKRCIACYGCQLACKAENGTPPGVFFARLLKHEEGQFPTVRQLFLPVLCNHCEDPPCVEVCPTGASFKCDDGIVDIDPDKCVGCRTCMMACPYGNRYFNDKPQHYFPQGSTPFEEKRTARHQTDVVMKCNFCRDRVKAGKQPACVANCPTVARYFGDLDDPNSEVSRLIKDRGGFPLHPELGTGPSVYYLPA